MKKLIAVLSLGILLYGDHLEAATKPLLRDYKYNKYSQFGEDGIIQKIFECIGTTSKLCVEFGSCDGLECANTANLWRHSGWKAILIEVDNKKYNDLLKTIDGYNCIPVHAFVGTTPDNSIDSILSNLKITGPIDLMSIDIDGDDYYIFNSLQQYRPRVIICEHNPTLPAELDIYQNQGDYFGCSVGALVRVGESKGYKLVAVTDTNCFFVDKQYVDKLTEFELAIDKITISDYVTYIASSYAGMPVIIHKVPKLSLPYGTQRVGYPNKLHHNHGNMRIKEWILGE